MYRRFSILVVLVGSLYATVELYKNRSWAKQQYIRVRILIQTENQNNSTYQSYPDGYPISVINRMVKDDDHLRSTHLLQLRKVDTRGFYPHSEDFINKILEDYFYRERFSHSPLLLFREAINKSETLNVVNDLHGIVYRTNGPQSVKPTNSAEKIFVFGGSSTFGMHVADSQTIPAQLEKIWNERSKQPVSVVNYGRCAYSWYQEFLLFQKLLLAGSRPRKAIFIDGLNSFRNSIYNAPHKFAVRKMSAHYDLPIWDLETEIEGHFRSYVTTKKLIESLGKIYNVEVSFIWQPHKGVNCQGEKYRFPVGAGDHTALYKKMATYRSENFFNLSHLCQLEDPNLYLFVDDAHYGPYFSNKIAQAISNVIPTTFQ